MNRQFVLNVADVEAEEMVYAANEGPILNRAALRIIGLVLSLMAIMFLAAFLHSYPVCIPIAIIVAIAGIVYRNMVKDQKTPEK